jgi:hypothetical protein
MEITNKNIIAIDDDESILRIYQKIFSVSDDPMSATLELLASEISLDMENQPKNDYLLI